MRLAKPMLVSLAAVGAAFLTMKFIGSMETPGYVPAFAKDGNVVARDVAISGRVLSTAASVEGVVSDHAPQLATSIASATGNDPRATDGRPPSGAPSVGTRGANPRDEARGRVVRRLVYKDDAGLTKDESMDRTLVEKWVRSSWVPLDELDNPKRLTREQLALLFRTEAQRRPFDAHFLRDALQAANVSDPSVPMNAVHPHTTATIRAMRVKDMRNVIFGKDVYREDVDWKRQIIGNETVPALPTWVLEYLVKPH